MDGLVVTAGPSFEKLAKAILAARNVDRDGFKAHTNKLIASEAVGLAGFGIRVQNFFVFQLEDHDAVVGVFKQGAILAFGFAQSLFGALALRHVAKRNQRIVAGFRGKWADGDVDWNFTSITAPGEQIAPSAH